MVPDISRMLVVIMVDGRTLREESRLRVFENRVLRRIFGPKREEVKGSGENYILRSLMISTPYPLLFFSTGATTHCVFVFCSPLAGL